MKHHIRFIPCDELDDLAAHIINEGSLGAALPERVRQATADACSMYLVARVPRVGDPVPEQVARPWSEEALPPHGVGDWHVEIYTQRVGDVRIICEHLSPPEAHELVLMRLNRITP